MDSPVYYSEEDKTWMFHDDPVMYFEPSSMDELRELIKHALPLINLHICRSSIEMDSHRGAKTFNDFAHLTCKLYRDVTHCLIGPDAVSLIKTNSEETDRVVFSVPLIDSDDRVKLILNKEGDGDTFYWYELEYDDESRYKPLHHFSWFELAPYTPVRNTLCEIKELIKDVTGLTVDETDSRKFARAVTALARSMFEKDRIVLGVFKWDCGVLKDTTLTIAGATPKEIRVCIAEKGVEEVFTCIYTTAQGHTDMNRILRFVKETGEVVICKPKENVYHDYANGSDAFKRFNTMLSLVARPFVESDVEQYTKWRKVRFPDMGLESMQIIDQIIGQTSIEGADVSMLVLNNNHDRRILFDSEEKSITYLIRITDNITVALVEQHGGLVLKGELFV